MPSINRTYAGRCDGCGARTTVTLIDGPFAPEAFTLPCLVPGCGSVAMAPLGPNGGTAPSAPLIDGFETEDPGADGFAPDDADPWAIREPRWSDYQ